MLWALLLSVALHGGLLISMNTRLLSSVHARESGPAPGRLNLVVSSAEARPVEVVAGAGHQSPERPGGVKSSPRQLGGGEPALASPLTFAEQGVQTIQWDEAMASAYRLRDELDAVPVALNEPDLEALSGDFPGRIELTLFIETSGAVGFVLASAELNPEQGAQVHAAFARLRFLPGLVDGLPVKSRLRIELLSEDLFQPLIAAGSLSPEWGGGLVSPVVPAESGK